MTPEEISNLREFLVTLFGNQAKSWTMNEKIFNLTFELVSESRACSNAMNKVPRPHALGKEPFKWIKSEARRLSGYIRKPEKNVQATCRVILQISEGSNLRDWNYSPVIRHGAGKICSAHEPLCLRILSSYSASLR